MATEPVSSIELWDAVQSVIRARESAKQSTLRDRRAHLRSLHTLLRAVAQEGDAFGASTSAQEGQIHRAKETRGVQVQNGSDDEEEDDREGGWKVFEEEYRLVEGQPTKPIVLPRITLEPIDTFLPPLSTASQTGFMHVEPEHLPAVLRSGPSDEEDVSMTDGERGGSGGESGPGAEGLIGATKVSLPSTVQEDGPEQEEQMDGIGAALNTAMGLPVDAPPPVVPEIVSTSVGPITSSRPPAVLLPLVPIPNFSIEVRPRGQTRSGKAAYAPRMLSTPLFRIEGEGADTAQFPRTDNAMVDESPMRQVGRYKTGIDPTLPRYMRNMPDRHPAFYPAAGTGLSDSMTEGDGGNSLGGYGDSLRRGRSRGRAGVSSGAAQVQGNEEGDEDDPARGRNVQRNPFEDLIPLEGSYASSLHPLPPNLPHYDHHHRHHHHGRDRRRSSGRNVSASGIGSDVSAGLDAFGSAVHSEPIGDRTDGNESSQLGGNTMMRDASTNSIGEVLSRLGKRKRDRDEPHAQGQAAQQMDLYETNLTFQVNPASLMLKKVTKCITTRDWRTAWQEIKLARAMERIEQLKEDERWAFRQRKKFRGPAIPKSHWDWMLEEMSWMAIDFKEERRWKIATAYDIAASVREWQRCAPEDRGELCVGGRQWGVPSRLVQEADGSLSVAPNDRLHLPVPGHRSDDASTPPSAILMDEEGVDEVLGMAMEVVDDAVGSPELPSQVRPGSGVVPDVASRAASTLPDGTSEDAEGEDDDGVEFVGDLDAIAAAGSASAPVAAEPSTEKKAAALMENALSAYGGMDAARAVMIAEAQSDTEFDVQSAMFELRKPILDLGPRTTIINSKQILPEADAFIMPSDASLADLFPDLLPAFAEPTADQLSGRSDKRRDESSAHASRLAHTSRLMDMRPVLVSSLQPGKHRDGAKWDRFDDDVAAGLEATFGVNRDTSEYTPALFRGRRPKAVEPSSPSTPAQPANHEMKAASLLWESHEDVALRQIVADFGSNWNLIADVFNSSRLTISIDKKSPWDCYQRHTRLVAQDELAMQMAPAGEPAAAVPIGLISGANASQPIVQAVMNGQVIDINPGAGSLHVDTSGLSVPGGTTQIGLTSAVTAGTNGTGEDSMDVDPSGQNQGQRNTNRSNRPDGPKIRVRQYYVREAIKRTQKRRDQTAKRPPGGTGARVEVRPDGTTVMNVHESHAQYVNHMTSMSPQNLSMLATHNARQQQLMEIERQKEAVRRSQQALQQQAFTQRAMAAQAQAQAQAQSQAAQAAQAAQAQGLMQGQVQQHHQQQQQQQQQHMVPSGQNIPNGMDGQGQQNGGRPTPPSGGMQALPMAQQQQQQQQQLGLQGRPSSAASHQQMMQGQGHAQGSGLPPQQGQQQMQMQGGGGAPINQHPVQNGQMQLSQNQPHAPLTQAQVTQMMQMAMQSQQAQAQANGGGGGLNVNGTGNGSGQQPMRMTSQQTQMAIQHAQHQVQAHAQAQQSQASSMGNGSQGQANSQQQRVGMPGLNGLNRVGLPQSIGGPPRSTPGTQDPAMMAAAAAMNARRMASGTDVSMVGSPVSAGSMPVGMQQLQMQMQMQAQGQGLGQISGQGQNQVQGSPRINGNAIPRPMSSASQHSGGMGSPQIGRGMVLPPGVVGSMQNQIQGHIQSQVPNPNMGSVPGPAGASHQGSTGNMVSSAGNGMASVGLGQMQAMNAAARANGSVGGGSSQHSQAGTGGSVGGGTPQMMMRTLQAQGQGQGAGSNQGVQIRAPGPSQIQASVSNSGSGQPPIHARSPSASFPTSQSPAAQGQASGVPVRQTSQSASSSASGPSNVAQRPKVGTPKSG